jgi:hypothetical protein
MKVRYIDFRHRRQCATAAPTRFFIVTTAEPKALALRYMPYQKFIVSPPKSFFKALFLGTELGNAECTNETVDRPL